MKAAIARSWRPRDLKLLVIDAKGQVSHHRLGALPSLLGHGDLVVANDAATVPASLHGVHLPSGAAVEVRLAARRSLASDAVAQFTAVVFGTGDYRTPTERRPPPPALRPGDELILGSLRTTVTALGAHPRLIDVRFEHSLDEIWEGIARSGHPIQYAYVQEPLAIWDSWTSVASRPVAFEAPSAGFVLDWRTLRDIRSQGAQFATLTHAAGISSTGDQDLDALLPFDEPYEIPASTARLIQQTKQRGGRIIAVGTTVVRALEHAARRTGRVRAGAGLATGRLGAATALQIVDAVISGMHESGSSHYELLRAFQDTATLERMTAEAEAREYLAHEFGDAVFIERRLATAGRSEDRPLPIDDCYQFADEDRPVSDSDCTSAALLRTA